MVRSNCYTSLVVMAALVAGCSGVVPSNHDPNGAGPTAAADDGDGVPAAKDRCPGTPSNATWTDSQGCAENQDGDHDGVPTDQDLCPNTPAGEKVDGNGCSASQKASDATAGTAGSGGSAGGAGGEGQPAGQQAPWQQGDDGKVAPNGFASFVLDPLGAFPVTLTTLAKNVKNLATGFELSGSVMIEVPGDMHVTLAQASVKLEYDSAKGQGLQSFSGTAALPFPNLGFMSGVSVDNLAYASIGYDLGKNIQNVNAPLKDDRKYFYFTFSAGFSATLGQMSVSTAANQSLTMTLDPSDPAFFIRASLGGLMGPVDEASVGFSIGGHLPFTPENTWGIDQNAASFDGHIWLGGKVNLNDVELPLAIGGNTVIDLDPNGDGKTVFSDPAEGFTFGSNSELDLSIDAKLLSFELPLAKSTIVGHIGKDASWGYYSGVIGMNNTALADMLPLKNSVELKTAGYVSSKLEDSYLKAQGDLSIDATKLGQWTGLDLADLAVAQATLNIDKNGALLKGQASTSLTPVIGLNGNVAAEAFFDGNPNDWYVTLDGQLAVKGIDLSANAHMKLDKNGMLVSGQMSTPISLIDMSGSITKSGVDLSGTASVTIPIQAGKEIVQWVTDAAVCGVETVTDAAVCGYQTVSDGAKCGYQTVTSAAQCGTQYVTSATLCGTQYVTDGAQCGYQTVTDGAVCGWNNLSGIAQCGAQCIGSGFTSCNCYTPKSCSVPKSCNIAATCQVAATCNIAKTCSVPASCEKVKTCEQKVVIPNFDYGSFKGSVTVKIGNSGLYGSVSGQYCATSGSCVDLANGYVKVTSGTPEACVTVSGLGDFCAKF